MAGTFGEGEHTSLDDIEILSVDVAVLGEIEVLLRDEYALCGDRVSACPLLNVQLRAAKIQIVP